MDSNTIKQLIYKDLSYSQLRSYCEVARMGSLSAAARSLQVSHPTVWKQVRALEQLLGEKLVNTEGGRSEVTASGRILAEIASPMVAEFEGLQERFRVACGQAANRLTVAAPPRSYTDDMMDVIGEFRLLYPDVKLKMREVFESLGNEILEAGEIDLVIGDRKSCRRPHELDSEKLYEIEPMVIMPVDHPLSRKKRVQLKDLTQYPCLNHPGFYPDVEGQAILEREGVFQHPDQSFELVLAASIRSCVKRGYGIGLVGRVVNRPPDPELVERSLSHCLPPAVCFGYRTKRVTENPVARAFMDLVKLRLGKNPA